ncbi:hypothetical protein LCGC14_2770050, partial [marine sediment metagenome]
MKYDINRPWLTLDPWQKEYIFNKEVFDNFLLCGRQVGKTTGMSIRSVELCINHFKKGEFVLINSITEKQGYHMLAKALVYAKQIYSKHVILKGKDKPTKHKLLFENGTGILCYAAGETGEGLRGFTIKKLMSDEGSRMSEEYFIAVSPMMSVVGGSRDIASTPAGKLHSDGSEKYFYKCSKDDDFKRFYVSAEDCPRHKEEFLEKERERLSKLAYAQEYLAIFTDELKRLFSNELIRDLCVSKPLTTIKHNKEYYLGVDVAGLGEDECSYEVLERLGDGRIEQRANFTEKRNLTVDTSRKIFNMNQTFNFKKIGVDDAGVGFGVWSELMNDDRTKRKTIALNNASRTVDKDGVKSKKILKEEININ